jgi:hypothetical protein
MEPLPRNPTEDGSNSPSSCKSTPEGKPLMRSLAPDPEASEARQRMFLLVACFCFLVTYRETVWSIVLMVLRPSLSNLSFAAGLMCLFGALCNSPHIQRLPEHLQEMMEVRSVLGQASLSRPIDRLR